MVEYGIVYTVNNGAIRISHLPGHNGAIRISHLPGIRISHLPWDEVCNYFLNSS